MTTTRGQGEYDSPHYMGLYLLSMSYLAAWAKDPAMKKRATMMLDYLIADYAPENLDGLYVGAHARVYEQQLLEKWAGVSSDFGYLWFGVGRPLPFPDNYILYYSVASGYQPPEILQRIATDRSQPYTHYERKRTRNRWRFNDELHGPVYKTTYVRREYAVSSDQGGVLQPIQQHSWDVTWHVPDPRGIQNTFLTLHPYSSVEELQTYFVFKSENAVEGVVKSKKTYDSPDKFLGGSPFEKIVQDQDTVITLYNIPPGTRFPHVNGFFSKDLGEVIGGSVGLDFHARRRRGLHRVPSSAAVFLEADRRRRTTPFQPVLEERFRGAGGCGIRVSGSPGVWTRDSSLALRVSSRHRAHSTFQIAARQADRFHLRAGPTRRWQSAGL